MSLRTVVGVVRVVVWQGKDPTDKHWGCPIRERWGLKAHQQMSPGLEEKLAFTATLSGSYEAAAQVAGKWGSPVDDSVIHALVQRVGGVAQAKTQQRLKEPARESEPQRGPSELALLMVDGWFARFRGPGWGKKRTKKDRIEWHEVKNGVFYLHEQAARTQGGRGLLTEKVVVRCLGQPMELGQRLHWEALHGGLARAKDKLVWEMESLGFGISKPTVGPMPGSCWISGMGANTCGNWGGPAMAWTSLKLRPGSRSDCTGCAMAVNGPSWRRLAPSKIPGAKRAKSSAKRRTILPGTLTG